MRIKNNERHKILNFSCKFSLIIIIDKVFVVVIVIFNTLTGVFPDIPCTYGEKRTPCICFFSRTWCTVQNMSDPLGSIIEIPTRDLLWRTVLTKLKNNCLTQERERERKKSFLSFCSSHVIFCAITWRCIIWLTRYITSS